MSESSFSANAPVRKQTEDFISLVDLFHICWHNKRWFVLSVSLFVSLALYKLSITPKIYTREAAIMVKQESLGKNAGGNASGSNFNDLGIVQQNISVNNVQRHLVSLDVLMEVVRRLGLAEGRDVQRKASGIKGRIKATIQDDKSTIINLKITDSSPKQAEQILYALVQVYNEKWIEDRNQVVISTSHFIDDRLRLLEKELRAVDDSISAYKSTHSITDLRDVGAMYLQQQNLSNHEILRLNNQKATAQYICELLTDDGNKHRLLPSNVGIENTAIESQIANYNLELQSLNSHLAYTSEQNPIIYNQERVLANMRSNIINNLTYHIEAIDIQLQSQKGYSGRASEQIVANPGQAQYLEAIERQKKVKESLYLYLLQKREENEINMTYASNNIQLIDIPNGSNTPTSPVPRTTIMMALVAGLFLPVGILFVKENLNSTIRDLNDLEHRTSLPVIGEVPFCNMEKKTISQRLLKLFGAGKNARLEPRKVVVEHGSQDMLNESFRVIRSHLEFMTEGSAHHENVYLFTSHSAGAGKTFVSMNLAVALAIKGRSVLYIDGDLRRASASHSWGCPKIGLSSYLSGQDENLEHLLVKQISYPTLDILPVGIIPPNPTELLSSNQLPKLIQEVRPRYDFIFIDCPPANSMADTSIIERYVDRTLFIIRAGLFERKNIPDLENNVQSGRYKHLSLILNGTRILPRYGYKYGYKYGYGYGYGYGPSEKNTAKREKRHFLKFRK